MIGLTKIGLTMIVRDEEATIGRCLRTVAPLIDHWTICDTGSIDATEEVARSFLKDIPGEYLHHDWVNFGTNRTLAMQAAKGTADYLLIADADYVYHGTSPETLDADAYMIEIRNPGGLSYQLPHLLRGDLDWRYEGAVHEYLACDEWKTTENLDGLWVEHQQAPGARAGRQEFYLETLHAALARNPRDARSAFYLAQTYRELGRWQEAIGYYRLRLTLGGWDEELFYSRYQLGCLLAEHVSYADGAKELLTAWEMRPGRVEPLRALANAANHIADQAAIPSDALFVHSDLYRRPEPPKPLKLLKGVA